VTPTHVGFVGLGRMGGRDDFAAVAVVVTEAHRYWWPGAGVERGGDA